MTSFVFYLSEIERTKKSLSFIFHIDLINELFNDENNPNDQVMNNDSFVMSFFSFLFLYLRLTIVRHSVLLEIHYT